MNDELYHHGTKGQKWGVRRYQNADGSLTPEGQKRYNDVKKALWDAAWGKEAKDKGPLKAKDVYKETRNSKWGRKQSRSLDWKDAKRAAYARNQLIRDYDRSVQTLTNYTGSKEKSIKMIEDFMDERKNLTVSDILKDYC